MQTCEHSYNNLLKVLHDICIYSNIIYFVAGILAIITFKKYYKLFGLYIILIGVVSVIHHSNNDFGLSKNIWGILDVVLANVGLFIGLCVLVYLLFKNQLHKKLAIITLFIGACSGVCFILSEIESHRAKQSVGTNDPNNNWVGPILTSTMKQPDKYLGESQQSMYLMYHSIWHILSSLAIFIWVICVNAKNC